MGYNHINLQVNMIINTSIRRAVMNKYLKIALDELENLENGEEFVVRDLWKGYEWNRIPKPDRLLIGRFFYDTVTQQKPCLVEVLDKTPAKQQKYKKI